MRLGHIAIRHDGTPDTGLARRNLGTRPGNQSGTDHDVIAALAELDANSFTGKGLVHDLGTVSWPLSSRAMAMTVSAAIVSLSSSRD